MVKLTDMEKVIHAYISLHGDKDVTSIGTHNESEIEYVLTLYDCHDDRNGKNPYTGKDAINILKTGKGVGKKGKPIIELPEMSEVPKEKPDKISNAMTAYFKMVEDIKKQKDKPLEARMILIYGALLMLEYMGEINDTRMTALWQDFITGELGL